MTFDDIHRVTETARGRFREARVLVVGDLMLDQYLWGDVSRISPEAPVPVVRLTSRTEAPGAAANVAANLAGLGLRVAVAGIVGRDPEGERLLGLVQAAGIGTDAILRLDAVPTVTKTRIIGHHHQMVRVDTENVDLANAAPSDRLITNVQQHLEDGTDVLVLSDYAKGVLNDSRCREIIARTRDLDIPVVVDPKSPSFHKYAGATALSPNIAELALATGTATNDAENLLRAATQLRAELGVEFIVMTEGEHGITLIDADGTRQFPTTRRQVYDVVGAGDTIIATLAAGLAAGLPLADVLRLSNVAAGIVVGKIGTAPIQLDELLSELEPEQLSSSSMKVCDRTTLEKRLADWKGHGDKIVFTNGCFDLLHAGHVAGLEYARRLGDRLVVGLNSDRSVCEVKGQGRPAVHQEDRARILAGLGCVDAVIIFDEDTPLELIKALRPDVLAKGEDYRERHVVGAEEVQSWGGSVVLLPVLQGRSSSGLLERIRSDSPRPAQD